ncbi:hypothetical protein EJB05_38481, partial [Eragrostis curvula]
MVGWTSGCPREFVRPVLPNWPVGSPSDVLRLATYATHPLFGVHKKPEGSAFRTTATLPREIVASRCAPLSEAMARASAAARRRAAERRRDAAAGGGAAVRKGPWDAEEDAVLREHVRTHGPRDWSSIRSKGLLPRTGKSCRLRWVNKLRPNLKSGCKFSAEEERIVLDLQKIFGNKWARIATYLQGRTDNDVKNFWSTRQKKMARLLRSPLPVRSGRSRRAKAAVASSPESRFTLGPFLDQVPFEGSSSNGKCRAATSFMDAQNAALVPYDQTNSQLLGFQGAKAAGASSLEPRLTLGSFLDQVPFEGSSSSGQCRAATSFMDAKNTALVPYDQTGSQLLGFEGALLPAVPATDSQASSSNARLLPEMTDNDVKNVGCTRQKRPAGRLLRPPLPVPSSRNRNVKTEATSSLQSQPAVGPFLGLLPFDGSSSSHQDHAGTQFMDVQNSAPVPYDQAGSQLFGFPGTQPPVAPITDSQASSSSEASLFPPQLPFYQPQYPLLDFPWMLGSGDTTPWFVNAGAMDDIANQELLPLLQPAPGMFPFFGMYDGVRIKPRSSPDHFSDLPSDFFDSDDQPSPSRTISDL